MLVDYVAELGTTRMPGVTVARIRGLIQLTTLAAASQGARCGAIVRNQRPLAAVADDGPYNAQHDDWFAWYPLRSDPAGPGGVSHVVVDVKAMRKIEELKDELQWWIAADAANAASCTVHYDLSVGLLLP